MPAKSNRMTDIGVLAVAIAGSSLAFIDSTVVNTLAATIQADLAASALEVQWVIEGYILLLTCLILPGGSLGDIYGRKKIFIAGVGLLTAASVYCGLAPSIKHLIAARAVQGVGAALLIPGSLAIITVHFQEPERGKAIGTWSAFSAISSVFGLAFALLADLYSWRIPFLANLPLGIVVIILAATLINESKPPRPKKMDWPGVIFITLSVSLMVFGLLEIQAVGFWHLLSSGMFTCGVFLFLVFIYVELKTPHPVMPVDIFANRPFLVINMLTLIVYAALGAILFFLMYVLLRVFHYEHWQSALSMSPFAIIMFSLSRFMGGLAYRIRARLIIAAGCLVAGCGFMVLANLSASSGSEEILMHYVTQLLPAIVIIGLGFSIFVAPLTNVVMSSVPAERSGTASGVNNAIARGAMLLAVALFGLLTTVEFEKKITGELAALSFPEVDRQVVMRQVPQWLAGDLSEISGENRAEAESVLRRSFLYAYNKVCVVAGLMVWLGGLLVFFFLPGDVLRNDN